MICRVCDSPSLELAIDLGRQPWCNHFLRPEEIGTEPYYPLKVVHCADCTTAQLDFTVPKEVMFGDHTYLSGVTQSLGEHFRRVAQKVDAEFFRDLTRKSVLDIGSNDGTQLKHFQVLGYDVLGVESSRTSATIARAAGVPTINAFFNLDTARQIDRSFHVINAAGVFFHLEELHSVTAAIRECLRYDGVFVVQFLYMKQILENLAFDQIYHEHLLYYNIRPLENLLGRHGLQIFDAYVASIHGGSVIAFVSHQGRHSPTERLRSLQAAEDSTGCNQLTAYLAFTKRIQQFKAQNLAYLVELRARRKRVWGLGAPVKGNTLLNYLGVTPELIECLVERNVLRRGLFAPGSHIPVVIEEDVRETPDVYYVLAWNFRREILARYRHVIARGVELYFPIMPPETLDTPAVQ